MWQVENHSPYPHHAGFQRDQNGRTLWIVTIKASFEIRHGKALRHLQPQPDLRQGPEVDGDRFLADGEVTLPRPMCDMILTGHAHPPDRAASARGWLASMRIGDWHKTIRILPARTAQWVRSVAAAETGPVPLDWSAAWGGPAVPENPVGKGDPPVNGAPLHRLAPQQGDDRLPVAFSAIPPDWPQRRRLGGTYDETWLRNRAPLPPEDMDPRFWQSAPPDQWLDPELLPGAEVEMTGIRPEPLRFRLPSLDFEIATRFRGRWVQHPPRLQILAIDSDEMRLAMVYQAVLPIGAPQLDVKVERSFIALRAADGISVAAADMAAFGMKDA